MDRSDLPATGQLVDQIFDLKRTLGQFTRLIEISLTLNSTLDQETILHSILETASTVLDCEAVSILLYDEQTDKLRFAASTDANPEELSLIPVPIDSSIAGTIFLHKTPQIINNLSQDPRHYQLVGEQMKIENRSLVGVPMSIRDKVIGVIEGINKKDGDFIQEDVDILSVIASQAAVAINNARLLESVQAAYEEVRRIDKIKSQFISIASHELRTPLFHILGYAQMLEEDTEGQSSENVKQVVKSAHILQSLVDDMTNMNLLETDTQELVRYDMPAQQILTEAYTQAQPILEAKNQQAAITLPKDPIYISADPEKLRRAFANVFLNASRFSPEDRPIDVRMYQRKDQVHISIKDHGIGIPPDQLDHIFDRFQQIENHMTRSYGGLGLGLPIARGIVELHGGKLWAESEGTDKGTTIHFTLPAISEPSTHTPPFIAD